MERTSKYEKKYIKYKTKYIAAKNLNRSKKTTTTTTMKGGVVNNDFVNFDSSILGFGTDGIEDIEPHKNILNKAINIGYRTFDLADAYGNIKIVGQIINDSINSGQVKREDLFINYKIRPLAGLHTVQNDEDDQLQIFYANINSAISIFSYLDCFMFHNVNFNNVDTFNSMLVFIQDKMKNGLIKHIGLSNLYVNKYVNINSLFDQHSQKFGAYGMKVEVIQQKFNHTIDDDYMVKLFKFCKENGVKIMVYGALGGKFTKGTCMNAVIDWREPLIEFNPIGYPNVNIISQKYNLDKYMLVLAYQSYKYDLIQIPITFNINRLESNYQSFNKAYELFSKDNNLMNMVNEDLRKINISSDTDKADLNYVAKMIKNNKKLDIEAFETKIKSILKFKSRLTLLKNEYETNGEIAKFLNSVLPYYDINEYTQILRSMLRFLESSYKYDSNNLLNSYLNNLNVAMANTVKNNSIDIRTKIDKLIPTIKIEQYKMADYFNYMSGEIINLKNSLTKLNSYNNIKIKIINDIPEERYIFLYYESDRKMHRVAYSEYDVFELFINIESINKTPINSFIWNNTKNNDFYKIATNLKSGDLIYVGNDQTNYDLVMQNIKNISFTPLIIADKETVKIYLIEQEKVLIINMAYPEIYSDDTLQDFFSKINDLSTLKNVSSILIHTYFNYNNEDISNKDLVLALGEQTELKFRNINTSKIVVGSAEKLLALKNVDNVPIFDIIKDYPPSQFPKIYQYVE